MKQSMHPYLKITLFTLLTISSAGWIGDGLKGDCLFAWLWEWIQESLNWILLDFHTCGLGARIFSILIFSFVFAFSTWFLYQEGRKFFYKDLQTIKTITPHRVLIIAVSDLNPRPVPGLDGNIRVYKNENSNQCVKFTENIEDDINAFNEKNLFQYSPNIQQLLRAIKPHLINSTLERIFLIGSEGDSGSYKQLGVVKRILKRYNKTLIISSHGKKKNGINFEDVEKLRQEYEKLVKQAICMHFKEQDIIIDVTGGKKTTSIAAAMVTFRHQQLKFQYIGSGENNTQELTFNIVFESPSKIT